MVTKMEIVKCTLCLPGWTVYYNLCKTPKCDPECEGTSLNSSWSLVRHALRVAHGGVAQVVVARPAGQAEDGAVPRADVVVVFLHGKEMLNSHLKVAPFVNGHSATGWKSLNGPVATG